MYVTREHLTHATVAFRHYIVKRDKRAVTRDYVGVALPGLSIWCVAGPNPDSRTYTYLAEHVCSHQVPHQTRLKIVSPHRIQLHTYLFSR